MTTTSVTPVTPARIFVGEGRRSDFGKLIKVDVGFGVVAAILGGWNAYQAIEKVDKEGVTTKSGVNLVVAAVSLAAAGMDLAGKILGQFPDFEMRQRNGGKGKVESGSSL